MEPPLAGRGASPGSRPVGEGDGPGARQRTRHILHEDLRITGVVERVIGVDSLRGPDRVASGGSGQADDIRSLRRATGAASSSTMISRRSAAKSARTAGDPSNGALARSTASAISPDGPVSLRASCSPVSAVSGAEGGVSGGAESGTDPWSGSVAPASTAASRPEAPHRTGSPSRRRRNPDNPGCRHPDRRRSGCRRSSPCPTGCRSRGRAEVPAHLPSISVAAASAPSTWISRRLASLSKAIRIS